MLPPDRGVGNTATKLNVTEIKAGVVRRTTVAQAIDYASCLASMPESELDARIDDYLGRHDSLGRIVRGEKRRAIPVHLLPMLERLEFDVDAWLHVVTHQARRLWGTTVGRAKSLVTEAIRRKQMRVANPLGPIG